ncbi:MAG: DUF3618 domain-containing protein [Hyphomicrobiales bacterium]
MKNGNGHHQSARAIENEADATRSRLAGTLDELANNLTPGRMLDEVLTYSRHGGGDFLRGLKNAAVENPIPALLIGAGCAMFLTGKGRGTDEASGWSFGWSRSAPAGQSYELPGTSRSSKGVISSLRDRASSLASSVTGAVSGTAARAGDAAAGAASGMRDTVTGTASGVRDTVADAATDVRDTVAGAASDVRDTLTDAASRVTDSSRAASAAVGSYAAEAQHVMTEQARRMRDQTLSTGRDAAQQLGRFVEEQPLVAAMGGFLIGAALAALLPRTRVEDEYLGATSDSIKQTARRAATQHLEDAKAAAGEVLEKVKDAAKKEGIPGEAVQAVADKVQNLAQAGSDALKSGTNRVLKG